MFAAALLYSAASVEISIYSTCKRISQKLLRNVMKFLALIYESLGVAPYKEIRCNMEELVLQGPEGISDVRIVNSYPSKVPPSYRLGYPHDPSQVQSRLPPMTLARYRLRYPHGHILGRLEVLHAERAVLKGVAQVLGGLKLFREKGLSLFVQAFDGLSCPQHLAHGVWFQVLRYLLDEPLKGRTGDRDAALAGSGAFLAHCNETRGALPAQRLPDINTVFFPAEYFTLA